MRIGFISQGDALLPEIDAYISFFSSFSNIEALKFSMSESVDQTLDVEWIFMGTRRKKNKNIITVHEYASASTPPFGRLKNFIKKRINAIPDFRIFFSKSVYKDFSFSDAIPYGFRSHGITTQPFALPTKTLYDFVYVGTTNKSRDPDKLFENFRSGEMRNRSLLVVSNNYQEISEKFKDCPNLSFKGPIPYSDVYSYIRQAKYGINYIPDKAPFNRQVSSKLIDYCACKIPIVTTDYEWVRSFQDSNGGNFFFLKADLSNFTWDNVSNFEYKNADVSHLTWEKQIRNSGVVSFLEKNFPHAFK